MLRRTILLGLVFVAAGVLLVLQNKVMVGTQELQALVLEQGGQKYDVAFTDLGGKRVQASAAEVDQLKRRLDGAGRSEPIRTTAISDLTAEKDVIHVTLDEKQDAGAFRDRVVGQPYRRTNDPRGLFHMNIGIDLRGGVEFICQLLDDSGKRVAATDEVMHILRNRLDQRGLTEPSVTRLSNGDVQVVIPGGTPADASRTRSVIENTGRLEFREVLAVYGENQPLMPGELPKEVVRKANGQYDFAAGQRTSRKHVIAVPASRDPTFQPTLFYHLGELELSGKDIADAGRELYQGQPVVTIAFTASGGARNYEFTSRLRAQADKTGNERDGRFAIVFDGKVVSAPVVKAATTTNCQIEGVFTEEQIITLRDALKGGSLSVTPVVVSERSIGASLGQDSVQHALMAMLWSTALIVIFMAIYYRRLGLVANACLAVTGALIFCTLAVFGATVTLPGLAGLVLTIGMAVDTNILIFERIREEQRDGRDLSSAIEVGYARAFWTIFDSHLTTLITAAVLYYIGSGAVKGFGLSLAIGIVVNLFSGVFVGRLFTDLICRKAEKVTMASWIPEIRLPYVRLRWIGYAASIVTGILGAAWFTFGHHVTGGTFERNFDIDFTGGNMAQVTFKQPLEFKVVESRLAAARDLKLTMLDPAATQVQPYYSDSTGQGASRQWVFRSRDEGGSLIEGERAKLEEDRAVLLNQINEARDRQPPDAAAIAALQKQLDELGKAIREKQDRIANRTQDFKRELAQVFASEVGAEGDEVADATLDGRTVTLVLTTLEKPSDEALGAIANRIKAGRDELADLTVLPRAVGTGFTVITTWREPAAAAAKLEVDDAVHLRLAALLTQKGATPEVANAWANATYTIYNAAVDAAARDRISVARAFPATEHFSGQVAGQMKWRALIALAVSLVAILAYVAARFEFAFGMGAIIALVHDVVLTVGLCSIVGIRIDLTVVASILTLIGYSINDTIVTFDRIRENLRKLRLPLAETIDLSIAQTMPRTILASATVIIVVAALFFFGGEALRPFSGSLLIGLFLGVYSSIFIASPLLLVFDRKGRGLLAPEPPPEAVDETKDAELMPG